LERRVTLNDPPGHYRNRHTGFDEVVQKVKEELKKERSGILSERFLSIRVCSLHRQGVPGFFFNQRGEQLYIIFFGDKKFV